MESRRRQCFNHHVIQKIVVRTRPDACVKSPLAHSKWIVIGRCADSPTQDSSRKGSLTHAKRCRASIARKLVPPIKLPTARKLVTPTHCPSNCQRCRKLVVPQIGDTHPLSAVPCIHRPQIGATHQIANRPQIGDTQPLQKWRAICTGCWSRQRHGQQRMGENGPAGIVGENVCSAELVGRLGLAGQEITDFFQ